MSRMRVTEGARFPRASTIRDVWAILFAWCSRIRADCSHIRMKSASISTQVRIAWLRGRIGGWSASGRN